MCGGVTADGITLDEDITGKPAVTAWLGAYIETISTHEVIASAVDAQAKVAFSFWQDKVQLFLQDPYYLEYYVTIRKDMCDTVPE